MGLSISLLSLAWVEVVTNKFSSFLEEIKDAVKINGFNQENVTITSKTTSFKRSCSDSNQRSSTSTNASYEEFKKLEDEKIQRESNYTMCMSPRPKSELDAAAVKLQKVYKSYRTRRNLADCAVVVEELWWKALDFAALKRSSVSFFHDDKHETAISRWARARTRAAKVGKGLSKSDKAQKLALQHWLEAIDPRHRYGHNLHFYYDVWFTSESTQPFFYWLDVGDGKEVNLEICPRNTLQNQCVQYLGPNERLEYEVIVEDGKLVYKKSEELVNTKEGSKWIFVLSTSGNLYVGKKKKGKFQHSSFLSGGAIMGAGRLIVKEGILKVIWPYSGHYLPTEENFQEFIKYLGENGVDLTDVKRCAVNQDESQSFKNLDYVPIKTEEKDIQYESDNEEEHTSYTEKPTIPRLNIELITDKSLSTETEERLSCNWATGAGPRIGCVRDYPSNLQCEALEQVSLSPRVDNSRNLMSLKVPIPSPRPGSGIRLSPRLAYMGFPSSPAISLTLPKFS